MVEMNFPQEVGLVVFGWFLGVVSAAGGEWYKRIARGREVRTGIWLELRDLRFRLAVAACQLAQYTQQYDRAELERTLQILAEYKGNKIADRLTKNISDLLNKATDAQLKVVGQLDPKKVVPSIKKFNVPFLETQIHEISYFRVDVQLALLDVRAQLNFFNAQADALREFFHMTFRPDIKDDNRERLEANLTGQYPIIRDRCFSIIEKIEEVLPKLR